jgi:hypothetical protein
MEFLGNAFIVIVILAFGFYIALAQERRKEQMKLVERETWLENNPPDLKTSGTSLDGNSRRATRTRRFGARTTSGFTSPSKRTTPRFVQSCWTMQDT